MKSSEQVIDPKIEKSIRSGEPLIWRNPARLPGLEALASTGQPMDKPLAAAEEFRRWAPLISHLFPETDDGQLVSLLSPLKDEPNVWLKRDCDLPITGSVKTRGGFYEVLTNAQRVARAAGIDSRDTMSLLTPEARRLFGAHQLAVGSTGNLGLGVGTIGAALGFHTTVHMSSDAKEWKKELLRSRGAKVVEHEGSYNEAVERGRADCAASPTAYFVDDENSPLLFAGYSAAAVETARQLNEQGVHFDAEHPLDVFLPCGVGGAPAGLAFGLACLLGEGLRFWLVEPVQFPSCLLGLLTGSPQNVTDWGLGGHSEADGLSVGAASPLALKVFQTLIDGVITLNDEQMVSWVRRLWEKGIKAEPSAASACAAWEALGSPRPALMWLTGGAMIPKESFELLLNGPVNS